MTDKYKVYNDGEEVIVYSLSDEKEYLGIVRGLVESYYPPVKHAYYMVEVDCGDNWPYSVRVISEHCIKPISKAITDKPNK